jgi:DNA-binding response OmpR family regulator
VSRESVEQLLYRRPPGLPPDEPRPFTVLVIEDDRYLLRLYEMTLARWPMAPRVVTASNGIEALVQIGRETPDLLVVDLQMPDMDGFHLLRVVRSMSVLSDMAIAVVTGLDAAEVARRGGLPAGLRLLPKPVPFDQLAQFAVELAEQKTLAAKPVA